MSITIKIITRVGTEQAYCGFRKANTPVFRAPEEGSYQPVVFTSDVELGIALADLRALGLVVTYHVYARL